MQFQSDDHADQRNNRGRSPDYSLVPALIRAPSRVGAGVGPDRAAHALDVGPSARQDCRRDGLGGPLVSRGNFGIVVWIRFPSAGCGSVIDDRGKSEIKSGKDFAGQAPARRGPLSSNVKLRNTPMRLVSFSVTNFRSITDAHRIPIGDSTVLLGRNNEGKSNVLRALSIAMKALTSHAADEPHYYRDPRDARTYSWRRDFPISLQSRTSGTESIFRLEFELTATEIEEFRETFKSNLNGNLPIEVKVGKDGHADIKVRKQGPGGPALSAKSAKVAKYVAENIQFIYIPAVRTEDEALSVVQEMLSNELAQLEKNDEYAAALQKISDLQQPILDKVSGSIKKSLTQFLPGIKGVSVRVPASARRGALRNQCQIEIDDGSRTLLEYKGDGVKSLAALGLLKDKEIVDGASIVAIEEPESHLHPGAMHSLREVIENLTATNQVVLTTHCPLFVDRASVGRNILIDRNKAKPARDIASIRELLGVRASDNLVNASHVLVVEGEEDVVALKALLPSLSPILSKALKQYQLVIEQIGGAGNLSYKLSVLSNALCVTHVLLDSDDSGKKAYEKAIAEKTLKVADVTFVSCKGMPASEMEDTFDRSIYEAQVFDGFGVDLNDTAFRGNAKWSDRMKACFEKQGKLWNDPMKAQVKAVVAEAVSKKPAEALQSQKRSAIDALVAALERKLEAKAAAVGEAKLQKTSPDIQISQPGTEPGLLPGAGSNPNPGSIPGWRRKGPLPRRVVQPSEAQPGTE